MNESKLTLFPETHQVFVSDKAVNNPASYFHSVWVGSTSGLINMPLMIWHMIILPLFATIRFIAVFTVLTFMHGLMGRVSGRILDEPRMIVAMKIEKDEERS